MNTSFRPFIETDPTLHREASTGPQLSVIVPVTERPEPLDRLYLENAPALSELVESFEFIFVIEPWNRELVGSLREIPDEGVPIRVLEIGQTMGESALLEAAAQQTRAPLILTLPPYARVRPEGLAHLFEALDEGAELATACRVRERDSWVNRLHNRVFHFLLKRTARGSFQDIASGVRLMRREVLDEVPLYGDFFRFLPLLAEREGFRVVEVALAQHEGDLARRLYSPGVYLRRLIDLLGLFFLVRFTQKPLRFFGLVGAGFSLFGAVFMGILAVQRLGGQALADRPVFLLGLLIFVLGVQSIALGLIGEIIVHFNASQKRTYRVRPRDPGD